MASTYVSGLRLTVLFTVALLALGVPGRSMAQGPTDARVGNVRGIVTDRSAGVLPGVVVTATAGDGKTLDTTVTTSSGEFTFDRLPIGPVDLLFHLGGFDDGKVKVIVAPAAPVKVAQQLDLQAHTENVVVHGAPPLPPPPPRPVLASVADHDQDSVCGPAKAEGIVQARGTVMSRRDEKAQGFFAAGDELLIDGGSVTGLRVGQNFVVRRRYQTTLTDKKGLFVMGEHSSGLLQIVSVDDRASTAVVVYACDEMMSGDYLAPFEPEPLRDPDPAGVPAFEIAARVLFGDAGRSLGVTNGMLVIDRGAHQGIRPGQRITLFRRSRFSGAKPVVVGDAVVVAVRRESATVRVERATDAIFLGADGDWAAPQYPPQRASK
ncbi:MAG: carboxypeptidase-like regulatory domain-containing protein [Acidobacteriota bacterium]